MRRLFLRVALAAVALVGIVAIGFALLLFLPGAAEHLKCPDPAQTCREVHGRVIHVQKRDPDGDGDMHILLVSQQSLTLPGFSLVKITKNHRVQAPGFGDWVSAVGRPMHGSHDGELELVASRVRVWR